MYDDVSSVANGIEKYLEKLRILPNANLPAVSCKKILKANAEEIDRVKLSVLELKSKVSSCYSELRVVQSIYDSIMYLLLLSNTGAAFDVLRLSSFSKKTKR